MTSDVHNWLLTVCCCLAVYYVSRNATLYLHSCQAKRAHKS